MSTAPSHNLNSLPTSSKGVLAHIKSVGLTIGNFFYGDELRTRRSLTFAYLSIIFYLVMLINADRYVACGL